MSRRALCARRRPISLATALQTILVRLIPRTEYNGFERDVPEFTVLECDCHPPAIDGSADFEGEGAHEDHPADLCYFLQARYIGKLPFDAKGTEAAEASPPTEIAALLELARESPFGQRHPSLFLDCEGQVETVGRSQPVERLPTSDNRDLHILETDGTEGGDLAAIKHSLQFGVKRKAFALLIAACELDTVFRLQLRMRKGFEDAPRTVTKLEAIMEVASSLKKRCVFFRMDRNNRLTYQVPLTNPQARDEGDGKQGIILCDESTGKLKSLYIGGSPRFRTNHTLLETLREFLLKKWSSIFDRDQSPYVRRLEFSQLSGELRVIPPNQLREKTEIVFSYKFLKEYLRLRGGEPAAPLMKNAIYFAVYPRWGEHKSLVHDKRNWKDPLFTVMTAMLAEASAHFMSQLFAAWQSDSRVRELVQHHFPRPGGAEAVLPQSHFGQLAAFFRHFLPTSFRVITINDREDGPWLEIHDDPRLPDTSYIAYNKETGTYCNLFLGMCGSYPRDAPIPFTRKEIAEAWPTGKKESSFCSLM